MMMNELVQAQAYEAWLESDKLQRDPEVVPPPEPLLFEELNSGVTE